MSDITLSSAVRNNLLSLQNTANLLGRTQERLATGLRVNSALDNPTNFFTSEALNSRANDLGRLIDSISNATQTIEAADNGISSLTSLIENAQAVARQALQTEAGTVGATAATVSGAGAAVATDTPASLEGGAVTAANAASDLGADGETLEFSIGSTTYTFDFFDSSSAAYSGSNVGIDIDTETVQSAVDLINATIYGTGSDSGSATINASGNFELNATVAGDTIEIDPGTNSDANVLTSFGLTSGDTADATNATLAGLSGSLTIAVEDSFFSKTFDGTDTVQGLQADLDAFVSANSNVSAASLDADGNLTVTAANTTDSITLGGTDLATFGTNLDTNQVDPVAGVDARAEALESYNELLNQIDQIVGDSGFNGKNLINGDDLKVIFNEDNTSSLTIDGVTFDAAGLGLTQPTSGFFDTDANLENTLDKLDTSIRTLRSQASTFGSNLSIIEIREDFTKKMINTLETGAANLTLADTNEEGANLLALNTRQALSSTALSFASQADQNVLRLF